MKTINDIRKQLKPLGYNVKTKAMSWGRHATYFRIADKKMLPSIFTTDTLKEWKPLIDWRKANNALLKQVRENTDTRGLV